MNPSPFIINLAPTGMVPTRADSATLPLSLPQIVADARACAAAGASMIHLHARDAQGLPSHDPALVGELVTAFREACPGLVIAVTTSGRLVQDLSARAAALYLDSLAAADMASLTLGSMNFAQSASVNAPATIQALAEIMRERGIKPELEVFDLGMLNYARTLIDKGLLKPPFYVNLLLGNIATAQTRLLHLATLLSDLPSPCTVSLAGLGRYQHEATALASIVADGARVGLEDSLHMDAGREEPATNLRMVQRAAQHAQAMGRRLATSAEVRERLGLRLAATP